MNNYIIKTTNLSKKNGKAYRVKDLDLQVPQGVVYGFLGPNGAGKTTTLKMILGLIKPTNGEIIINGERLTNQNQFQLLKNIGSLVENPGGYGHLTGLENLQIIQKLKGVPEKEITRVLKTVRLSEQRDKLLKNYSLGMKQRLGIAMALLGNPKILILDEPTNGLDPVGIQEIRELIRSLAKDKGITVIVSSHLLSEIEQMADYVGIINHGELLFQGELASLETDGNSLEDVFLKMTEGGSSL